MRWSHLALAMGIAVGGFAPATANAAVIVNYSSAQALPSGNDFSSELADLGLTRYAAGAAELILDAPGTILFEFLGSESLFSDSFEAPGVAFTETSSVESHFDPPAVLGSSTFPAGSLEGLLGFFSSAGRSASLGESGFTVFLGPNQLSGQNVSTFYIGFDDQLADQDDDFDDLIIRGTYLSAVPEPGTWAMLILGLSAIGYFMRSERRKQPAPVTAS